MRTLFILSAVLTIFQGKVHAQYIPECYNHVDQVFWVVTEVNRTVEYYKQLGFSQFSDLGTVTVESKKQTSEARLIRANLGGARINWIQPTTGHSIFHDFFELHGEGAMSLVHRFPEKRAMKREIKRLSDLGVEPSGRVVITAGAAEMEFVFMDTDQEGKYTLGFTYGKQGLETFDELLEENRNGLKLSQYAFAIRDPEPVSAFWKKLGLPELAISHPELGNPMYYGEPAEHELIQGWQRHGTVAYEWCIPVKPPIVYEDHIKLHGEGIHHLAFNVADMDLVLEDYTSKGFVVSMGGTWGESGKPGSGRYEYIDLEKAGGLTMELLWNYRE